MFDVSNIFIACSNVAISPKSFKSIVDDFGKRCQALFFRLGGFRPECLSGLGYSFYGTEKIVLKEADGGAPMSVSGITSCFEILQEGYNQNGSWPEKTLSIISTEVFWS